jgi:hypothetical protein
MSRPQLLGIYPTRDAADKAALDPYYRRLGAVVADIRDWTPIPGMDFGLIVPPAAHPKERSRKGS